MNRQNRSILIANMGFGPLVGLAVLVSTTIPVIAIAAASGAPLRIPSASGILSAAVLMATSAYAIGLVPAFLHSCIMVLAMRTGASRGKLLLISPFSGFFAVALFSAGLPLLQGETFSSQHFASGLGGIIPAFVCMLIAFRWMDQRARQQT